MDGNGPLGRGQRDEVRTVGHLARGVGSAYESSSRNARPGLEQLDLYCSKPENWKRPQAEIDFLMALLKEFP